ncbi:MAG: hypothetical protein WCK34_00940, partial [Bacteroidota bacterium]
MTGDRFILLVSDHRRFGPVVSAWEVTPDAKGWSVLQNRLTRATPDDMRPLKLVALHEIIDLSDTFSDGEIHRQFSRPGTSLKDFLDRVTAEILQSQIRPFIDRKIDKILRLAIAHDIGLYIHDGSSRVYYKNRLIVYQEQAEPWFCFTKTPEGSNYVLELFQNEKRIHLQSDSNRIICRNPCWYLSENRLHHLPEGFDGKKIEPFLKKETLLIPATSEKKYFETFILKTLKTGQVKATGFKIQSLDPVRIMELSAESDWQGRAILVIWFRYGDKRVMAGRSQKVFID